MGVFAGGRGLRAGGEWTWSRIRGQAADERGFMIRQDCILFMFSRACLTKQEGEEEKTEEHNYCSKFAFCKHTQSLFYVISLLTVPSLHISSICFVFLNFLAPFGNYKCCKRKISGLSSMDEARQSKI